MFLRAYQQNCFSFSVRGIREDHELLETRSYGTNIKYAVVLNVFNRAQGSQYSLEND